MNKYLSNKKRRIKRIRAKIKKVAKFPKITIFRYNKNLYAQVIDDTKGITLVSVNSITEKVTKLNIESAKNLGKILAQKAGKKKIKSVVFDRGSYKYHGKVKSFAEGAREGGLKF